MQVISNGFGLDAEQPLEMLHALLERFQRFIIFHVTDVMTQERIIFIRNAKCIFQFRASRQQRRNFPRQFDGKRRISARAADGIDFLFKDAHRQNHRNEYKYRDYASGTHQPTMIIFDALHRYRWQSVLRLQLPLVITKACGKPSAFSRSK